MFVNRLCSCCSVQSHGSRQAGRALAAVGDCFLQPQVASIVSMLVKPHLWRPQQLTLGDHHTANRDLVQAVTASLSQSVPTKTKLWFLGTVTPLSSPAASKASLKELTSCLVVRGFYFSAYVSGARGKCCHLTVSWGWVSPFWEFRQHFSTGVSEVLSVLLLPRLCWSQRHLKDLGKKLTKLIHQDVLLSPCESCHVCFVHPLTFL